MTRPAGASSKDPTEAMRLAASRYPGVDEGTACTQSSFKPGKKAFLYVGMQGGRSKAMFKLDDSLAEAGKLARQEPDRFQVGTGGWVTARFSAGEPLPKTLWKRWLDESYALSTGAGARRTGGPAAKPPSKAAAPRTPARKGRRGDSA